jgi:hypothetical protein
MEGFGVKKIMEQLKEAKLTVTQIVHDKDASTMKQAMEVFEDVEESLCLSILFCPSNLFSSWLQEFQEADPEIGKDSSRAKAIRFKIQQSHEKDHFGEYSRCCQIQVSGGNEGRPLLWLSWQLLQQEVLWLSDHNQRSWCQESLLGKFYWFENLKNAWYTFGEVYSKYKMADTTNIVEGLHSVRWKFVEKRLNFGASYQCRANISILAAFLDNWEKLILEKLNIEVTPAMEEFFKVF